jgi:uncharacterized protein YceK
MTMKALLLVTIALVMSGCAGAYTSIQPPGEPNKYYVTKTHAGFFKQYGTLYQCEASGAQMTCSENDAR